MSEDTSLALFTLLPPFYDVPLHDDFTIYLRRIEEEFKIQIEKYTYLWWAFDNDVFIINDSIVFRFPRTAQSIHHLPYEIDFLNYLKNKVQLPIPQYSYISKKGDFGGYKKIPGNILTPSNFKKLSKKNKELIIDQLIGFINTFHKIKLSDLKKYNPEKREVYIPIEKRIERELKEKLFPKLSKKEVDTINDFYTKSKKYLQNAPTNCAIHGDFYIYNVLWNKDTAQVGVIDFSNYAIGDGARDFEVFYDFGPEYAEMAYAKYKGQKDSEFLQRAQIYYKVHGIYTLLSSLLGAQISYEYAYSNFFKEKFNE